MLGSGRRTACVGSSSGVEHAVLLLVDLAGLWARPRAVGRGFETDTRAPDPAQPARRDSGHERVRRNVLRHHGTRRHERPGTDRQRCDADRSGPDGRAVANLDADGFPIVSPLEPTLGATARGYWSFVSTAAGPMKTPSPRVAGS